MVPRNLSRDLGETDGECAAFLHRKREELSETRQQVLEVTPVAHATSLDSPSVRVNEEARGG